MNLIVLFAIYFSIGASVLGHIIPQNDNTEVYEVSENEHTGLKFMNPKRELPTLREIIFYHVIEKPFGRSQPSLDSNPRLSEQRDSKTERGFTNAHAYGGSLLEGESGYDNEEFIPESETIDDGDMSDTEDDFATTSTEEEDFEITPEMIEKKKAERKILFDAIKEKYRLSQLMPKDAPSRRKRAVGSDEYSEDETEESEPFVLPPMPEAPQIPPINYDALPEDVRILISTEQPDVIDTADKVESTDDSSTTGVIPESGDTADKVESTEESTFEGLPPIPEAPQIPPINYDALPEDVRQLISTTEQPEELDPSILVADVEPKPESSVPEISSKIPLPEEPLNIPDAPVLPDTPTLPEQLALIESDTLDIPNAPTHPEMPTLSEETASIEEDTLNKPNTPLVTEMPTLPEDAAPIGSDTLSIPNAPVIPDMPTLPEDAAPIGSDTLSIPNAPVIPDMPTLPEDAAPIGSDTLSIPNAPVIPDMPTLPEDAAPIGSDTLSIPNAPVIPDMPTLPEDAAPIGSDTLSIPNAPVIPDMPTLPEDAAPIGSDTLSIPNAPVIPDMPTLPEDAAPIGSDTLSIPNAPVIPDMPTLPEDAAPIGSDTLSIPNAPVIPDMPTLPEDAAPIGSDTLSIPNAPVIPDMPTLPEDAAPIGSDTLSIPNAPVIPDMPTLPEDAAPIGSDTSSIPDAPAIPDMPTLPEDAAPIGSDTLSIPNAPVIPDMPTLPEDAAPIGSDTLSIPNAPVIPDMPTLPEDAAPIGSDTLDIPNAPVYPEMPTLPEDSTPTEADTLNTPEIADAPVLPEIPSLPAPPVEEPALEEPTESNPETEGHPKLSLTPGKSDLDPKPAGVLSDEEEAVMKEIGDKLDAVLTSVLNGEEEPGLDEDHRTFGVNLNADGGHVWNDIFTKPGVAFDVSNPSTTGNPSRTDDLDKEDTEEHSSHEEFEDIAVNINKRPVADAEAPKTTTQAEEDDVKHLRGLMEILKNEQFWTWMRSWFGKFMQHLTAEIKKTAREELITLIDALSVEEGDIEQAEIITAEETLETDKSDNPTHKTTNIDVDAYSNIDIEALSALLKRRKDNKKPKPVENKPENGQEEVKPDNENKDVETHSHVGLLGGQNDRKKGTVAAETIFGNSVNSHHVTNLFIFYPNEDLGDDGDNQSPDVNEGENTEAIEEGPNPEELEKPTDTNENVEGVNNPELTPFESSQSPEIKEELVTKIPEEISTEESKELDKEGSNFEQVATNEPEVSDDKEKETEDAKDLESTTATVLIKDSEPKEDLNEYPITVKSTIDIPRPEDDE